jgi:hypothetical protein
MVEGSEVLAAMNKDPHVSFNVLELILGFYSPYLKTVVELVSFSS